MLLSPTASSRGLIFLWCVTSECPVVGQEKKIPGRHGTQEAPLWESCVLEYVGARAYTLDYTSGVKAAQLPALD